MQSGVMSRADKDAAIRKIQEQREDVKSRPPKVEIEGPIVKARRELREETGQEPSRADVFARAKMNTSPLDSNA